MNKKIVKVVLLAGLLNGLSCQENFGHSLMGMFTPNMLAVHNAAKSVNIDYGPTERIPDISVLVDGNLIAVDYRNMFNDPRVPDGRTLFAFRDMSREKFERMSEAVPNIAEIIKGKITEKDEQVILTGYGYGANLAAKVASALSLENDQITIGKRGFSKIGLVMFNAQERVQDDLSKLGYTECLHFTRFFNRVSPYDSQCLEIPMLLQNDLSSRFSGSTTFAASCVFGLGCLASKLGLNSWVGLGLGSLGSLAVLSTHCHPQYFTTSEIESLYDRFKGNLDYYMDGNVRFAGYGW